MTNYTINGVPVLYSETWTGRNFNEIKKNLAEFNIFAKEPDGLMLLSLARQYKHELGTTYTHISIRTGNMIVLLEGDVLFYCTPEWFTENAHNVSEDKVAKTKTTKLKTWIKQIETFINESCDPKNVVFTKDAWFTESPENALSALGLLASELGVTDFKPFPDVMLRPNPAAPPNEENATVTGYKGVMLHCNKCKALKQAEACNGDLHCPTCHLVLGSVRDVSCDETQNSVRADAVDHPPHYNEHPSGVECITIVEHFNFNLGNAIKYIWRAGLKSEDAIEDLKKAAWYVNREIERLNRHNEEKQSQYIYGVEIGQVYSIHVNNSKRWNGIYEVVSINGYDVALENVATGDIDSMRAELLAGHKVISK